MNPTSMQEIVAKAVVTANKQDIAASIRMSLAEWQEISHYYLPWIVDMELQWIQETAYENTREQLYDYIDEWAVRLEYAVSSMETWHIDDEFVPYDDLDELLPSNIKTLGIWFSRDERKWCKDRRTHDWKSHRKHQWR